MCSGVESGGIGRNPARKSAEITCFQIQRIHKMIWRRSCEIPHNATKMPESDGKENLCQNLQHHCTYLLTDFMSGLHNMSCHVISRPHEQALNIANSILEKQTKFPFSLCYFFLLSFSPPLFPSSLLPAGEDACVWTMPVSDFKPAQHLPAFAVNFHGL